MRKQNYKKKKMAVNGFVFNVRIFSVSVAILFLLKNNNNNIDSAFLEF